MKLKNKKTGEIVYATMMASYGGGELQIRYYPVDNAESAHFKEYRSISELNEEWEDYEEPKEYWYLDYGGRIKAMNDANDEEDLARKEIGNYFSSREEAELVVRKLQAWKRLKDIGFKFTGWRTVDLNTDKYYFVMTAKSDGAGKGDLDLLFGGEDEQRN